jgi:hypothetical protein
VRKHNITGRCSSVPRLTIHVEVDRYGERYRATVTTPIAGIVPDETVDLLLTSAVRDDPRQAVVAALEFAAGDVADELGLN